MTRPDAKSVLIVSLAALCVWLIADRRAPANTDGGGGDSDRGLIAVTGAYGSGASALYLIDSRTRHMAVYRLENGRSLEFVAARDCSFDLYLETLRDESEPWLRPSALRKSWQEVNRKLGSSGTTPATAPGGETEAPSTAPAHPTGDKGNAPPEGGGRK